MNTTEGLQDKSYNFQLNLVKNEKDIAYPAKESVGFNNVQQRINVFTEFGNLKALIMGYMDDTAQLPADPLLIEMCPNSVSQPYPEKLYKRAQEIQNQISQTLMDMGIHVIRPGKIDHSKKYVIEGEETTSFQTFSSRDMLFYYHDSVFECPSAAFCRQYEYEAYNWITDQHRKLGDKVYSSWVSKPNPQIPLFDAAQMLRLGLDILFLISIGGNEEGYKNFKKFMNEKYNGKVRVHPLPNLYYGLHIDSTLVALGYNKNIKKFVLLANGERTHPGNIPVIFRGKNWVVLESNDMFDNGFEPGFELSTKWIGQNFMVINPELVMIEQNQTSLIKMLEFYGVKSLKVPNEIGRSCAGGIHCMTNDYCREEEIDFEKILTSPESSKEELAGYFDPELLEYLQNNGEIEKWEEIANKNGIFPTYLVDHLTEEEKAEMKARHQTKLENFLKN